MGTSNLNNLLQFEESAVVGVAAGEICYGYLIVSRRELQQYNDRDAWDWTILSETGRVIATSTDDDSGTIHAPVSAVSTSAEIMSTLLSFLLAFREARSYGAQSENYSLFPDEAEAWVVRCDSELEYLHLTLSDMLAGGEL